MGINSVEKSHLEWTQITRLVCLIGPPDGHKLNIAVQVLYSPLYLCTVHGRHLILDVSMILVVLAMFLVPVFGNLHNLTIGLLICLLSIFYLAGYKYMT